VWRSIFSFYIRQTRIQGLGLVFRTYAYNFVNNMRFFMYSFGFRNVGKSQSDAREIPQKNTYNIHNTVKV
jgi:hypothetical protein